MYYRPRDGDAVATLVLLIVVGVGVVTFFACKAIAAGIKEGAVVHAEYAGTNTRTERVLKWTLIGFLATIVVGSGLGLLVPMTAPVDVTAGCWSFLVYAIVVASAGRKAQRAQTQSHSPVLDDYLDFSAHRSA